MPLSPAMREALDRAVPNMEDCDIKATPKHQMVTRAEKNTKAEAADEKGLEKWRHAVRSRDKGRDRFTGQKTEQTLKPLLRRAENHHLVSRAFKLLRADRRNGIHLSHEIHAQVERGDIQIRGTVFFELDGKHYINADHPVYFDVLGDGGEVLEIRFSAPGKSVQIVHPYTRVA